jgi:formylglycine-generating enzyme
MGLKNVRQNIQHILVVVMVAAAAFSAMADINATTNGAQLPAGSTAGFESFKKNVYPILRNQCVECHAHGPGPSHSSDDPVEAYRITRSYVSSFQNLHYVKLVTKGTNGHGNAYGAKKTVTLKEDELVAALQKWWDQGENTVFFDGKKILMPQSIPAIPNGGSVTMTWNLSDMREGLTLSPSSADLQNTKFQIDIERFMEAASGHDGAYRIKNPRFVLADAKNIKVAGVYITMNGQFDGAATDYSSLHGIVSADSGGVLSSQEQIVLDGMGPGKDKIGFAFSKIALTTEKPTLFANNQRPQLPPAQPAKPVNPKNTMKVFDPSIVGDKAWRFAKIPAGQFEVGSLDTDPNHGGYGGQSSEQLHKVCVNAFEIQATDVTQLQWNLVMGNNPSNFVSSQYCDPGNAMNTSNGPICKNHPVEQVSWNDVQEFLKRLNQTQSEYTYRLPTESEWEYVAHNGLPAEYSYGFGGDFDGSYAWFSGNSNSHTHEVGTKEPLYLQMPGSRQEPVWDIYGNVWQWTSDWYDQNYGLTAQQLGSDKCVQNPQGPTTGSVRVVRGGGWFNDPQGLRAAYRDYVGFPAYRSIGVGFRLLRTPRKP